VGDTGAYINGLAFKESDWGSSGFPIIRIQNLTDPTKPFNRTTRKVDPAFVVEPGDILVSWSATLDAFIWRGETALLNQHIFKVIPNEHLIRPRFLYYLLRQAIAKMRESAHVHGSTMKHINRGPFLSFPVPLPPLAEQHRIVAAIEEHFSRLDAAVASLERARAGLKRYRVAVLAAACSGLLLPGKPDALPPYQLYGEDGTDARRVAEARVSYNSAASPPSSASIPPRSSDRTNSLPVDFPTIHLPSRNLGRLASTESEDQAQDKLEGNAQGSRMLPDGWTWTTLGALLREPLRNGHSAPAATSGEGVRTLTLTAVTVGDFSKKNTKLTSANPSKVRDLWLEAGDLLIERSNTPELVGTARLYRGSSGFAIFPDLLIRARVAPSILDRYAEIVLQSDAARRYFRTRAQGIAGSMPKIDQPTVEALPVPLPPLPEQHRIVAEVERRLSVVDELEATVAADLKRAERLRQAILRRAFAGKLVPQDPSDEPASVLLERIKEERASSPPVRRGRGRGTGLGAWTLPLGLAKGEQ
jgi:type I restriction enzyme S subunit